MRPDARVSYLGDLSPIPLGSSGVMPHAQPPMPRIPRTPHEFGSQYTAPHAIPHHVHNDNHGAATNADLTDDYDDGSTLDSNGRRRRVYKKTQYTCSHCPLVFSITSMDKYCEHVIQYNVSREFKCTVASCPWSIVGFQRKLERDRHYARKHGKPSYECRFWGGEGKEKFLGAGVCTTQWHADSGNRSRHEKTVHGYYVPTHRGRGKSSSSLDEMAMVQVKRRRKKRRSSVV
ncbi:uncharacterized protein V1510DRAFT_409469 [Dipodascopsis tothii]|uniref:uncharacterized protein n=1 Tax=Dipodascopsis tothii TaxID=44089 RepID=UPI0034CDEE80